MKNYTLLIITILSISAFMLENAHAQQNDVLKPLHDKIKADFINKNSAYIAQQMREKKNISDEFQQYLKTDNEVKKIKQAFGHGTGRFSVEVVNKQKEITNDFQHKIDELNVENKWSITKENLSKVGFVISTLLGLTGGTRLAAGEKSFTVNLMSAGIVGGIASWVMWSWSAQEQKEKQIHIKETVIMQEKWAQGFKIKVNE